jgi:SAM-dependent methyltransferase
MTVPSRRSRASDHELPSGYEDVASEYYDNGAHPTCANFRHASKALLKPQIRSLNGICRAIEVGAGKSVFAEILIELGRDLREALITDASPAMLQHSRCFDRFRPVLAVADCKQIPVEDSSVDLLIASLGDPYNSEQFWQEVERTLRVGGVCLFTTPSFEWAARFRSDSPDETPNGALFVLRNGRQFRLPSIIYPVGVQSQILRRHQLILESVKQIELNDLGGPISPKLLMLTKSQPVVTEYVVRKPFERRT